MFDQNVGPIVNAATTAPDEAAKNIALGNVLQMNPDNAAELNKDGTLENQIKQNQPVTATPNVANMVAKNTQVASIATANGELKNHNLVEDAWTYGKSGFELGGINRDINDLVLKKMDNNGQLQPEDEFNLQQLNDQAQKIQTTQKSLGLNPLEEFGIDTGNMLGDFVRGLVAQRKVLAATTGVYAAGGALAGGTGGLMVGGPGGAAAGAFGGAITGAVSGFVTGAAYVAPFVDGYTQGKAAVYNNLSNAVDPSTGTNLNISESEKVVMANGAGVLMAAAGLLTHKLLVNKVPWLQEITDPTKAVTKILTNPVVANYTRKLGETLLIGGAGGGIQELARIIAEETAKSGHEYANESGFMNIMMNSAKRYQEVLKGAALGASTAGVTVGGLDYAGKSFNMITDAATRGGLPGGLEPVAPTTPTQPKIVSDIINRTRSQQAEGTRALDMSILLGASSDLSKDTQLKIHAPEELDQMRKSIAQTHGVPYVWVDPSVMQELSKKSVRAKQIMDRSGLAAEQMKTPMRVTTQDFLAVADDHPEVVGDVRPTPDSVTANEFIANEKDRQARRLEILGGMKDGEAKLGHFNDVPAEKLDQFIKENVQTQEHANNLIDEAQASEHPDAKLIAEKVASAKENLPLREEKLNELVTPKEIVDLPHETPLKDEKFHAQEKAALHEVADAVQESPKLEMDQVRSDVPKEIATQEARENQARVIESDPNIATVERYQNFKHIDESLNEAPGKNPLAINPDLLPPEIRNKYIDDPILKKRGVFAKDGLAPEEAAGLMGVRDVGQLLEVLAKTPDRERARELAADLRKQNYLESITNADIEKSPVAKAYDTLTKVHLKAMQILAKAHGAIADAVPSLSDLATRARDEVMKTPVNGLDPNQWKVGGRRTQREVIKAIESGDALHAFNEKQKVAQNAQLAKEAHIAVGKINKADKFIARLMTPKFQEILKNAAPEGKPHFYTGPVNEILDLFGFDPSKKGTSKEGSYDKFANQMLKEAKGDFRLEPETDTWMDGKTSAKDLSVDQYLYLTDRLQNIVKQAELKNRIIEDFQNKRGPGHWEPSLNEDGTPKMNSDGRPKGKWIKGVIDDPATTHTDLVAQAFYEIAKEHPDYDANRTMSPQGDIPGMTEKAKWFSKGIAALTNPDFIALQFDKGVTGGFMAEMIIHRLKGIGKFEGTGLGMLENHNLIAAIKKNHLKVIKDTIGKDYWNYGTDKVTVPEFANVKGLNNGKVTRLDLLMLLKNMGNEDNQSRVSNWDNMPSTDVVMKVLERELPKEAFDYVQKGVWNLFKSFKPRMEANEKATTGNELNFVQPKTFTAHGETYEGGYYPIFYDKESSAEMIRKQQERESEAADGRRLVTFEPSRVHDGLVSSPFTKERTGSDWTINLRPETFAMGVERVAYDMTMRVPVRDSMAIVQHPKVADAITSVVGQAKYNILQNSISEATKSFALNEMQLYSESNRWQQSVINHVQGVQAVSILAGNISTMIMQFGSMPFALLNMGPSGAKHIAGVMGKYGWAGSMGLNWKYLNEFAREIDPNIKRFSENIDNHGTNPLLEDMPKKYRGPAPYRLLQKSSEAMIRFTMNTNLGGIDSMIKTLVAPAAYTQFLNGEAKGWPMEKIMKMTEAERYAAAKAYGGQISAMSTTSGTPFDRASIQKQFPGKLFSMYWNVGRNALNSNLQAVRNMKYDLKDSYNQSSEGNSLASRVSARKVSQQMMTMAIVSSVGQFIRGWASGNSLTSNPDDRHEPDALSRITRTPGVVARQFLTPGGWLKTGDQMWTEHIPVVNAVTYGLKAWEQRNEQNPGKDTTPDVNIPFTKGLADIAVSGKAAIQAYSSMTDFLDYQNAIGSIDKKEAKAIVNTMALFTGSIPVNAGFKLYDNMGDIASAGVMAVGMGDVIVSDLVHSLKKFIGKDEDMAKYKGTPEQEAAFAQLSGDGNHGTEEQQAKAQAQVMLQKLTTPPVPGAQTLDMNKPATPLKTDEDFYKRLVFTESNNHNVKNAGGGSAFGYIQMEPKTFQDMVKIGRSEGLMKSGFKSPSQQKIAMKLYVENRIQPALEAAGLPVNFDTVYTCWHFGEAGGPALLTAKDTDSFRSVLESIPMAKGKINEVFNQNNFKKTATVADIKSFVADVLAKGTANWDASKKKEALAAKN